MAVTFVRIDHAIPGPDWRMLRCVFPEKAYTIGPLQLALEAPYFFTFIGTFYNATQSRAGATIMSCIIILLNLCSCISNVATASRQMFAFARDQGLPFADFISHVSDLTTNNE